MSWEISLTAVLLLALLLAPRGGFIAWFRGRSGRRRREEVEDALKHLLDREYRGRHATFATLAGALHLSDARLMAVLSRLQQQRLVEMRGEEFHLTREGERLAIQVVRAHRLWERYLVDEARRPLKAVHQEAERAEHSLTREQVDRLDASLGHPERDPHGDPIPTREGELPPPTGTPLTSWPSDEPGRIVHLEDEPPLAYAQIVAEGLHVGQVVRVLEASPARVLLSDGTNEFRLAPAVAANVFLSAEGVGGEDRDLVPLSSIPAGTTAVVVRLDEECQGFTRRRLLDLGFTPGATITPDLQTFAGDPRAYRVRGSLIALRADQASRILVRPASAEPQTGTS